MEKRRIRTIPCLMIGLVLLSTGCHKEDRDARVPVKGSMASFYDLKGFFSKEIKRLDRLQPEGTKTVRFDGASETIDMKGKPADYSKELASFVSSDINKLSWREKYRIDTVSIANGMREIRYTALDEHLKTREIRLLFKENSLKEVRIKNRLKSIIAESTQELSYITGSGYAIEGVQGSRIGRSRAFSVSVALKEKGGNG
ncbi:MAG: hypothetical protein IPH16_03610 [Haliscomenobacter sp.]|nr:hypothetical protein [Haliscomenobacter sp.]MBK7475147.1 hypothetical protein [Haliscomenobacter sp.]MBK8879688.1 hypothetical protein [Haliscomenobacter sp.]